MLRDKLKNFKIILASQSPRRKHLLKELDIDFEIETKPGISENYPNNLDVNKVASYLSGKKADAYIEGLDGNTILITADTIVILNNKVINKPIDRDDAIQMITKLSGNVHTVITGVSITSLSKRITFSAKTDVFFKKLTDEEIEYYIDNYQPFDKAGAYGIQEWIGYIAIERIDGSYFNVMGLPVQKLYDELMKF